MRPSRRHAALTVGALGLALLGAPPSPAAAATTEPVPVPSVAPDSGTTTGGTMTDRTAPGSAALCTFQTGGDYVHVSSSAFEASGHGWWVNGNCNATTAVVTVQLQQYYSDGSWRNVGTKGSATVRSGGGAGNRATGRAVCSSSATTSWRSVVDVDLVGLLDDPTSLTTPSRSIACRW
ncbi:hypothetical protein ACIBJE_16155 [Micromonospora sp. NPDC050187]|uniref:hypothetical protein n=1 Tax=Micromonospora sp. NPDC050187 TaxID=3364277 RepID=UPI00379B7E4B